MSNVEEHRDAVVWSKENPKRQLKNPRLHISRVKTWEPRRHDSHVFSSTSETMAYEDTVYDIRPQLQSMAGIKAEMHHHYHHYQHYPNPI